MSLRLTAGLVALLVLSMARSPLPAAEPASRDLFARKNLVAWCIVPFDAKRRGPEERAAMLERLGFRQFAYDYRAEHIPSFDAEIEALKRHHVELTAWWFPGSLNDEAKMTLALFARHKVTPQLWVTGGGGPTQNESEQRARVQSEAARIRTIAEAAAKVGCKVALYNHGGWFGEPENQIAIIHELKLGNVGIVYNQHHGHDHLDRFPELLQKMKPHLYALNLNGMVPQGDRQGQKILQLGQGKLDLKLLKIIRDSGYSGPIGILGHTQDDAEARLHDNLDGLDWLLPQLDGQPPGPRPQPRTPVPRPAAANAVPDRPVVAVKPLTGGKFGLALDGRAGGAFVPGRDEFRQFPMTVECWTRQTDKSRYNILVAHELKSSGTHWELFSIAGSGNITAYVPGFTPDHCHSSATICDNQWHHVAMVLEPDRIRLYLDGKPVADQRHTRSSKASEPGGLALASLVDKAIGCSGLVDEVRISKGARAITASPDQPFVADDATIGLWHLDELVEQKRLEDASLKRNSAILGDAGPVRSGPASGLAGPGKIEGHWGEEAIGFRWTEADSRDDRFGKVDGGPFFSGSITGAGGPVYKGIVVRVGDRREASICYDAELLRVSAGWHGFLRFDPARFGIIVPPKVDGEVAMATPRFPGVSLDEMFANFRETSPFGPLPKEVAHYQGLYRHGQRVVVQYTVGRVGAGPVGPAGSTILETPWLESSDGAAALTRTFRIGPCAAPLRFLVADAAARVRLHPASESASLVEHAGIGRVMVVAAHDRPITIKLLAASAGTNEAAFERLVAASPVPEDVTLLTMPGPRLWGEPLVTRGELGDSTAPVGIDQPPPYVVDTITLPFDNPFNALFFCGGHDFLPDGRAAVCTLHGDVWLVDGIDQRLQRITWRRFATGLFQPLGLKVVQHGKTAVIHVVGRDQITRLHDRNGDGEADFYENFNNDAHVTLNGHEYVTCLETDRAGNFYYVKGNCNSQTPHDGSLLRVSPDGATLTVHATGFRNSNGIGMGPNDEITVAPQEGEWTPASAVFLVREGGFYGGMMSHHRSTPPTDFERPLVWFPRLADNSSGGQVWTTSNRWGPLANQLLHLSYGQCRLRLVLRDAGQLAPLPQTNGGSIELPLRFTSGIHRGRMSPHDGQLYVTGLKGWTTSAVHDGCFQRVRYTGGPLTMPVGLETYKNGVALKFSQPLDRAAAEDPANYRLEAWNYKWSAAYGSPEYRPSAPGQIGRDEIEARSATLLPDARTVFLEIPKLAPVDQLAIGCTLLTRDGHDLEPSVVLTLNSLSTSAVPEQTLHRRADDPEQARLLASLVPGILVHDAHTAPLISVQRMIAWDRKGRESSANPGDGLPRTIAARGWLRVPTTGRYRFTAAAPDSKVYLGFDKRPEEPLPIEGREISLSRGVHQFTVSQVTNTLGNARFRLLWESPRFPREAIPAALLSHSPAVDDATGTKSAAVAGADLFETRRCTNCHQTLTTGPGVGTSADDRQFVNVLRSAPLLDGVGSRLQTDWMARWIREPHRLRSDATMPGLIAVEDAATADDIAAYLGTLREPAENAGPRPVSGNEADDLARTGEGLYERLGCIACHTLAGPDEGDDWNRVSLHFMNAKYRPQSLARYLLNPHRHHAFSRMPDFRLSENEVAALVQFLRREADGQIEVSGGQNPGDPVRGRVAFEKHRCAHCHLIQPSGQLARPDVPSIHGRTGGAAGGCLAEQPANGKSPRFHLEQADREALLEFAASAAPASTHAPLAPRRSVDAWAAHLRCTACHARDVRQSPWAEIIAVDGSGKPAEAIPQLTWVGEKLQGPWIESLLKGEVKQKPRPWLTARMPAFPAYASLLAQAMSAEHGVTFAEPVPVHSTPERVETGRLLTLRDGGLDCRQCHGVGKEQPRGDAATQIALGINFALARQRLRPEFALRQMLDPPRYDVGSRMPRFAPDLRTTAARQIENGDAIKQFELLKEYLWSVPE